MRAIGEGIAFVGLCATSAWLEVSGNNADGLWIVVVIWAVMSDWGK